MLDNGASHIARKSKAWLAAHPRWHVNWTPPHAPWPNQVELPSVSRSWQLPIAALENWAEWSLYAELLACEPFRYIDKTVMTPQDPKRLRVNAEHDVDDNQEPLRIV